MDISLFGWKDILLICPMKYIKSLLVVSGVFLIASCSRELDFPTVGQESTSGPVFQASIDEGLDQSRTQLDENDGMVVTWSPRESISVFDGDETMFKFTSKNQEPALSADFVCDESGATLIEPDPGDYYYALYPYDPQASLENGIIHTSYPSSFEISRYGSFDDKMNLSVAASTSYSMSFKNLSAWLRLAFMGDEVITKIVFKGNNGEKLAGKVDIDVMGKVAAVKEEGSSEQLVLTGQFLSSESPENGHYYYIPLLALSFEKGFTIMFYKDDGTTYTYVINKELEFNRGKRRRLVVDLSALDKQYTYIRVKTPSGASLPSFLDGDEYIVAYPTEGGYYKVFSPDMLFKNIESYTNIGLTDFLTSNTKRYEMVGVNIFNKDYVTVLGNEESITVDPGLGVQVVSKTATLENETASFPKSHTKTKGIKMTISDISMYQWDAGSDSGLAKGTLNSDDMYVLADQILSRHNSYFSDWKWNLAVGTTDADLKGKVAGQYNGDYGITAGYIESSSYEGFAFKDKFLFSPSTAFKKVYIYRRTPVVE